MTMVGVLLSGCGVFDGSEIHEAVITLLALDREDVEVLIIAPDIDQTVVVNHLKSESSPQESRNVLIESARIARGVIQASSEVNGEELDALILPGGLGAANNLTSFALDGPDCTIHRDVQRLIRLMVAEKKPVGAVCIAPVVVARALRDFEDIHPILTIGNNPATAAAIETMGSRHMNCKADDIVVDIENRIVTTPAYMLAESIGEVAQGIEKLVSAIVRMIQ